MSSQMGVPRVAMDTAEAAAPQVLRLHDVVAPAHEALRRNPTTVTNDASLGVSTEVLEDFLDRRASQRLQHYDESFAKSYWKPKLALVLPADFSADRPTHRRDLTVALEVLASAMEYYNVCVVSDSHHAARLFRNVTPYSPEAISACAGALVLLSRSLNDEVNAVRPSRYVGSDPCAFRVNKKRIVFEAGGLEIPLSPVGLIDVERETRGGVHLFLDENDDASSYLEALRSLRSRGVPLRIILSSRADEAFARQIHDAFAGDPRAEVHDAEPLYSAEQYEFRLSNEPIALLTQRNSTLPRFLFQRGEFWRLGAPGTDRSDYYLFRGEESNATGLIETWLGGREQSGRRRRPRVEGVTEPLVSVVVPIYDRTAEILRMAHSIYQQDYPWIEVVFVSNGSPPETIEAMRAAENYLMKRRFRVHTIELAQACGSATIPRDLGIRASSGELICVLDSDDWLSPGFFSFLRKDAWREDTLYYPQKIFRDHGRTMRKDFPFELPQAGLGSVETHEMIPAFRRHGNFLCNSGVCFPRALFVRGGGIDHRLSYGEDLYLWCRCARAGGRSEEHEGYVNISLHPGNNELLVGDDTRLAAACALADAQEMTQWL